MSKYRSLKGYYETFGLSRIFACWHEYTNNSNDAVYEKQVACVKRISSAEDRGSCIVAEFPYSYTYLIDELYNPQSDDNKFENLFSKYDYKVRLFIEINIPIIYELYDYPNERKIIRKEFIPKDDYNSGIHALFFTSDESIYRKKILDISSVDGLKLLSTEFFDYWFKYQVYLEDFYEDIFNFLKDENNISPLLNNTVFIKKIIEEFISDENL